MWAKKGKAAAGKSLEMFPFVVVCPAAVDEVSFKSVAQSVTSVSSFSLLSMFRPFSMSLSWLVELPQLHEWSNVKGLGSQSGFSLSPVKKD